MALRIDTIKYQGEPAQTRSPVFIDQDGGSIGRAMDNSVVLHDEAVSRRHALISFENGRYYLIDESSNGTFIYNRDLLIHGDRAELIDGDVLRIGDHELRVHITTEKTPAHVRYSSISPPRENAGPVPSEEEKIERYTYRKARSAELPKGPASQLKELNIDDFFKDTDDFRGSAGESSERVSGGEAERREASGPPDQPQEESPHAYREEKKPAPEASKTSEQIPQAPIMVSSEIFDRFMKGAGLDASSFTNAEIPDLMESLGAVFRELVNGLWTILRGRAEMKAEIRVAMTMVRPSSNNALKFSPTLEDAVRALLKRNHPSFLEPIDAVRESFDDIMNHQLALNAGIQASLVDALDHLDPQRFSEKNKDSSILHTKGKFWKAYCEAYPELKEEALEGIFGKAFIRAYQDQLERLRIKRTRS